MEESSGQVSLLELADWAKEKFQWKKIQSKQAISGIIRNRKKCETSLIRHNLERKESLLWTLLNLKNYLLNSYGKFLMKIYV